MNSASPELSEIEAWVEDQDFTRCVPSMRHPPEVLFLVLRQPAQSVSEKALMYRSIAALVWTPVQAVSAVKGLSKVNDCRSFNARLSEEQRRGTQSHAGYEWLDELFPLPDLGVTGLDPVFGVPINQDH